MMITNAAIKMKCHDKKLFQNGMEKFMEE